MLDDVRYVILGAGGVGGTIGGRLAEAGHEVVLLARGAHARTMRDHGLRLLTPEREILVRPEVAERPDDLALRPDDLLVLSTKTQDTESLLAQVADLPVEGSGPAGDRLPVVCAQNGVENERIALRRFRRVIGMCVMLPAQFLEPGRIEAHGTPVSGMLEIGRYPTGVDSSVRELAAALNASGFRVTARETVMPWKYAKLLRNLGNALEALCGIELDDPDAAILAGLADRARAEGRECLAAAAIDVVDDEEWDANRTGVMTVGTIAGTGRGGGSSWQSLQRGTGSIESDALNGEIVLLGRTFGPPTPVNEVLQEQANALLKRGGRPGDVTPRDLLRAVEERRAR